jgi:hypothetical protein
VAVNNNFIWNVWKKIIHNMDSIKKEQAVAGVIGGVTAFALAYITRRYV